MSGFRAFRSAVPHDRLTLMANDLVQALRDRDDADTVKAIVLLQDGEAGGLALHGYGATIMDEETASREAAIDMILHLRSLLRVSTMDLATVLLAAQQRGML